MHAKKIMSELALVLFLAIGTPGTAVAQVTVFSDQSVFEAALSGGFTLINLDDQPLSGFAVPYTVESAGPAAAFSQLGIDFQMFDATVVGDQAFQIPLPGRDRLILNGVNSLTAGELVIDLVEPVHGFGARSNNGDGGRIRAFSEPRLGGTFLGEAPLGAGAFGGLISPEPIRSIEITCEFDFDLICGIYDLQHGEVAAAPIDPRVAVILLISLSVVGIIRLRRAQNV